ncbi:MAG TPA: hypothetical protein VHY80_18180 [Stellaceae bacterium]|nr:hypothetical protein [Stellaceae bacterium]
MIRTAILVTICSCLLAGCASTSAQNAACAREAHNPAPTARGNLPWGYYPGYGSAPVPPAETHFS